VPPATFQPRSRSRQALLAVFWAPLGLDSALWAVISLPVPVLHPLPNVSPARPTIHCIRLFSHYRMGLTGELSRDHRYFNQWSVPAGSISRACRVIPIPPQTECDKVTVPLGHSLPRKTSARHPAHSLAGIRALNSLDDTVRRFVLCLRHRVVPISDNP